MTKKVKKRMGRPVTVNVGDAFTMRLPKTLQDALDGYAAEQGITRAEAIRKLLERSLKPSRSKRTRQVDDPPDYGEHVRALYAAEEGLTP